MTAITDETKAPDEFPHTWGTLSPGLYFARRTDDAFISCGGKMFRIQSNGDISQVPAEVGHTMWFRRFYGTVTLEDKK